MRPLLFIILAGYAVRCNEASYYVIEMPDASDAARAQKPLRVYWNVPTMQCESKKIPFNDLFEKFGIIQNYGDSFRGEKVSIMYDPGLFPALLKNETSGKFKFRNGGVPQEGDLEKHLVAFKNTLEQSVPDKNFGGIGIIDFESWRPVFRQNFGVLIPYKDISYQIERKLHWFWTERAIQARARERFEEAGRAFMQTTLSIAKQLRPRALWGYYGFPYCFNMAANNMVETCSDKVKHENDKIDWLWAESTALYPSIYSSKDLSTPQLVRLVRGRVAEARRVARRGAHVLPYFWFRYRDGGFLSQTDLNAILETLSTSNASGFIIWGSSNDVNTVDKCNSLYQYTEEVMGPAIAKYTKATFNPTTTVSNYGLTTWRPILRDHLHNSTTSNPTLDPEYHWVPPENYTQDIVHYVEQEFKKKPGFDPTDTQTNEDTTVTNEHLKDDFFLDMLLKVFNSDKEVIENTDVKEISVNEKDKQTNPTDLSTSTTVFGTTSYYFEHNTSTPIAANEVTQNPLISLLFKYKKKGVLNIEVVGTKLDDASTKHFDSSIVTSTPHTTKGYDLYTDENNEIAKSMTNNFIEYQENTTSTTEHNGMTEDDDEIINKLLGLGAIDFTETTDYHEKMTSNTEASTRPEKEEEFLSKLFKLGVNDIPTEVTTLSTLDNTSNSTELDPTLKNYEDSNNIQDYTDVPFDNVNTLSTTSEYTDVTSNHSLPDITEASTLETTVTMLESYKIIQKEDPTKNEKKGYPKDNSIDFEANILGIEPETGTAKSTHETESFTYNYRDIIFENTGNFITEPNETDDFNLLQVNILDSTNNELNSKDRKKGVALNNDTKSTNSESAVSIEDQELIKSTTENEKTTENEVPDVEKEGFRIENVETTTEEQEVIFL